MTRRTTNQSRLKESNDPMDFMRMQTEYALFKSMMKSKTLTLLVVVSTLLFVGFGTFLFNMAL